MTCYTDIIRYQVRLRRLGFKVFAEYNRFRLEAKGKNIGTIRFYDDGKPDVTGIADKGIAAWLAKSI